jgi:hypothetical protein
VTFPRGAQDVGPPGMLWFACLPGLWAPRMVLVLVPLPAETYLPIFTRSRVTSKRANVRLEDR